jgi:hypothetical protein
VRQELKAKPAALRTRSRAARAGLADFAGEIIVVCPRCGGPAVMGRLDPARRDTAAPRRVACRRCGHIEERPGRARPHAERHGRDPFFGLPLWLATPCCGEVLWAFNARHLAELERFALARLRERGRDPEHGWSNRAFESRLPCWIKSAKHRVEVAKGLTRLRERLAAAAKPN